MGWFLCPVRDPSGVMWTPHRCSVKSPALQVHEELKIQHNLLDLTRALRAGKMGN